MRLYYLAGQVARPGMTVAFYVYNRVVRQPRARAVVFNEDGEILLVRTWGGQRKWSLPGGGVERGEHPKAAAQRELLEETGIDAPLDDFSYVTTLEIHGYKAPIYAVTVTKNQLPAIPHNPREITHLGWFAPHHLPEVSPAVRRALQKLASRD